VAGEGEGVGRCGGEEEGGGVEGLGVPSDEEDERVVVG